MTETPGCFCMSQSEYIHFALLRQSRNDFVTYLSSQSEGVSVPCGGEDMSEDTAVKSWGRDSSQSVYNEAERTERTKNQISSMLSTLQRAFWWSFGRGAPSGGPGVGDAAARVNSLSTRSSRHQADNPTREELDRGVRTPITPLI